MAGAQMLMKTGAGALSSNTSLGSAVLDTIVHILTSPALFSGYALYGISTVILILALRHGELSLLYPFIALNYVWVTILSVMFLNDSVSPLKLAGLAIIVVGVAVMGSSSKEQRS